MVPTAEIAQVWYGAGVDIWETCHLLRKMEMTSGNVEKIYLTNDSTVAFRATSDYVVKYCFHVAQSVFTNRMQL